MKFYDSPNLKAEWLDPEKLVRRHEKLIMVKSYISAYGRMRGECYIMLLLSP